MRFSRTCILIAGLASSAVALAQEVPETREYSRRGEVSVGAQAPSHAAMVSAIQNASPEKLKATLEYGERVACAACVPLLEAKLLTSRDARVRELSAWWLRRQPFAAPPILMKLKEIAKSDPSAERRARAAEALGEFMDNHALGVLSDAAKTDADPVVRSSAVRALARLNDEGSAAPIAAALADPALAVRAAALDVLLTVQSFRDFAALVPLLADADPALRAHAARLLGELRIAGAEGALGTILVGDPSASARKSAAWALGRIGGTAGRALLVQQKSVERDTFVLSAIQVAERMPARAP
jgi:HEAT repeat protein